MSMAQNYPFDNHSITGYDPKFTHLQPGDVFQHLIETVRDTVYLYRLVPDRRLEYVSPAVLQMLGYTPDELVQDPDLCYRMIHPDDKKALQEIGGKSLSNPIAVQIFRKDGTLARVEFVNSPIYDSESRLVAVEGIARDISARNPSQVANPDGQALLSSIITTAVDAIVVVDSAQNVVLFNTAAETMFGYPAEEMIGHPIEKLIPEQARAQHSANMQAFGRTDQTRHRMANDKPIFGSRADGKLFPIEVSLSTFEVQEKRFSTAIIRDVTERKLSEEKLFLLTTHDPLTDVYNRSYFEQQLARYEEERPDPFSVVITDVDNLQYINDVYGQSNGDDLLKDLAMALKATFRSADVVARLGGDEFGVMLTQANDLVTNQAVQRIRTRLLSYNRVNRKLPISLSIGMATASNGEPLSETLKRAEAVLRQEKRNKQELRKTVNS